MQTLIAQYKIFGKKPSFEEKKNLIKIGCLKKIKTGSFGFFKFRVFLPNPAPHTKYDLDGKSVLSKMSIFYWKNEHFLLKKWGGFTPPQGLPGMAHLSPKSYLQISSEKLKKNMTFMENLCLKKWVAIQKWPFYWKNGGFFPPGPLRFAGYGSFEPQILPTSFL